MKQHSSKSYKSTLLLVFIMVWTCLVARSQEQLTYNSTNEMAETGNTTPSRTIKKSKWFIYKNDLGAFSVKLPHEPSDISRDATDPTNPEAEPYRLAIVTANDEKKSNIYLIRYNDMPSGFYLNDVRGDFSSIEDILAGKDTVLSFPN